MRIHENNEIQNLIDELENLSMNIQDEEDFLNRIYSLESIAIENKDSVLKLVTTYHKSDIPYIKGDMETCRKYIQEALNLSNEINQTYYLLRCYNSLAILDSEVTDYYSSISHYLQALHIADLHPEYQYGAALSNNIGNLFVWMNEHEKALDYLLDAVDKYYFEKTENSYTFNILALNIIEEYSILNQYDKIDKWLELKINDEYVGMKYTINIILTVNKISQLYKNGDIKEVHKKLDTILNPSLKYDNYIYIFRSYMRLLEFAINAKDKKSADSIISCMNAIEQTSQIKTFKYDYVVLKYQYYETFLEENDVDGNHAKEVLKEYFYNSQNVIGQLRNTYTRRLVIESELLKVRFEKESAEKYNDQLQKEIELDYFTKILNKMSIEKYINREVVVDKHYSKYALLLIDIDHFKTVNDNYGHDYGDKIILSVVDMINSYRKDNMLFGRFGGDEFLLFIKGLENETLLYEYEKDILEKARHIQVDSNTFLTLSIGGYILKNGDDFNTAFNCADNALYEAKRNGRNQFCMHK